MHQSRFADMTPRVQPLSKGDLTPAPGATLLMPMQQQHSFKKK